jgi:hypothetical protein
LRTKAAPSFSQPANWFKNLSSRFWDWVKLISWVK